MAINRQDSRHRIKRSNLTGVVPTVPTSSDFTDGTWLNTDLRSGELFWNEADNQLFIGATAQAFEIALVGGTGSGNNLEQTLAIGNSSGAQNISMGTTTVIKSDNGGGQINLDLSGTPNTMLLSSDGGSGAESYMFMTPTNTIIGVGTGFTSTSQTFDVNSIKIESVDAFVGSVGSKIDPTSASMYAIESGGVQTSNTIVKDSSEIKTLYGSSDGHITTSFDIGTNLVGITLSTTDGSDTSELSISTTSINLTPGPSGVIVSPSAFIKSGNGGGQIDLDYFGSAGEVSITTDNGNQSESYLYMTPTDAILVGGGGATIDLSSNVTMNTPASYGMFVKVGKTGLKIDGRYGVSGAEDVIRFINNGFDPTTTFTTQNSRKPSVSIASQNSTINAGIPNGLILGGSGNTLGSTGSVIFGSGNSDTNSEHNLVGGSFNQLSTSNLNSVSGYLNFLLSSGNNNVSGGYNGLSASNNNIVSGSGNSLTNVNNSIVGGSVALVDTAESALIMGYSITSNNPSSYGSFISYVRTTNAGPGGGGSTSDTINNMKIPLNSAYSVDILGVAVVEATGSSGAVVGDSYRLTGNIIIKNVAGTTTLVGSGALTVAGDISITISATAVADNTNDVLLVRVTPSNAGTASINWSFQIRYTSLRF